MSRAKDVLARLAVGRLPWGTQPTDRMLTMHWDRTSGWTQPQIEPLQPISLSPAAAVFHYGMEVFEGLKAFGSVNALPRLFRPDLNIARLNRSADRLALPTVHPQLMMQSLREFVYEQRDWVPTGKGTSLYVRPCIIATDAKIGVRPSDTAMFFTIAFPVGSFFADTGKGVRLLADATYIRAWKGGVGNCKTGGNYALTIAPAMEAKAAGFDQIMWLSDDHTRKCTEVGMMNAMFVFKDPAPRIVTPRLDGTILEGVTRQSVIDLAPSLGIDVEQRDITIDEVVEGVRDGRIVEMFGTGTAAVVSPIRSITYEGEEVSVKPDGKISQLLHKTLTDIYHSPQEHPWMIPAEPPQQDASKLQRV